MTTELIILKKPDIIRLLGLAGYSAIEIAEVFGDAAPNHISSLLNRGLPNKHTLDANVRKSEKWARLQRDAQVLVAELSALTERASELFSAQKKLQRSIE